MKKFTSKIDKNYDSLLKDLKAKYAEIQTSIENTKDYSKQISSIEGRITKTLLNLGGLASRTTTPEEVIMNNAAILQQNKELEKLQNDLLKVKELNSSRQTLISKAYKILRIIDKIVIAEAKQANKDPYSQYSGNRSRYDV
ncbi:hypothetical protein JF110_001669 [Campylobacter jejuni]|nr:hypothetical protein [Campylobacter jejuni]